MPLHPLYIGLSDHPICRPYVLLDEYKKGLMRQCFVIKYSATTFLPYIPGYVDEFLQPYLLVPVVA
jgi:hypothetical protein